jgi:hypothetical protein
MPRSPASRSSALAPALALSLLMLAGTVAQAQPAPQSPPVTPAPSKEPACPPGTGGNAPTVGSGQSGNLSDRLAGSNGVICPPAGVDQQMRVSPPQEGGRMPVIPPPGAPGGDQTTVPK